LLYLPTQIRFPIGGERVTCRGSKLTNSLGRTKLTNSLGKQQLELSTRSWSGHAPRNRSRFVSQPASSNRFLRIFFYFRVGRYNTTLNDWSRGKQWVLSSLDFNVHRGEHGGCRGNKTHCFPWGQSLSAYSHWKSPILAHWWTSWNPIELSSLDKIKAECFNNSWKYEQDSSNFNLLMKGWCAVFQMTLERRILLSGIVHFAQLGGYDFWVCVIYELCCVTTVFLWTVLDQSCMTCVQSKQDSDLTTFKSNNVQCVLLYGSDCWKITTMRVHFRKLNASKDLFMRPYNIYDKDLLSNCNMWPLDCRATEEICVTNRNRLTIKSCVDMNATMEV